LSRSCGFDPALQSRTSAIPLPADSLLLRAWNEQKPVSVQAADGRAPAGLLGEPVDYAMALPMWMDERGTAVVYGEDPSGAMGGDPDATAKIAAILSDHVRGRVRVKAPAAPVATSPPYSPARQARRVKIYDATTIAINGTPSTLIDLS